MKVESVEQYKILQFIEANFMIEYLNIELIDRNTIKIEDENNDTLEFKYIDGKVVY